MAETDETTPDTIDLLRRAKKLIWRGTDYTVRRRILRFLDDENENAEPRIPAPDVLALPLKDNRHAHDSLIPGG